MTNFRNFDRDTGFLLPPSVNDGRPERHLARFVAEIIDALEVSAMSNSYRGSGSASYHPKLLLAVLEGEPEVISTVLSSALFAITAAIAFSSLTALPLIKASLTQVRAIAGAPAATFLPIATAVTFSCFPEFPLICTGAAQRLAPALDFQNNPSAALHALF